MKTLQTTLKEILSSAKKTHQLYLKYISKSSHLKNIFVERSLSLSFFLSLPLSLFYDSAAAAADSVGNKSEGRQAEWNGNSTFLSHNNYDVVIRYIFYEFLSTSYPVLQLSPEKK